jgi:hypothetical protein
MHCLHQGEYALRQQLELARDETLRCARDLGSDVFLSTLPSPTLRGIKCYANCRSTEPAKRNEG